MVLLSKRDVLEGVLSESEPMLDVLQVKEFCLKAEGLVIASIHWESYHCVS